MRGGGIGRLDAAAFRDVFSRGHPERKVESFTKRDGLTSDLIDPSREIDVTGAFGLAPITAWTTSANLPFFPPSPNQELPLSASRRKRTAGSGLAALTEEDCGSPLRKERHERITCPEITIQSLYETQRGTLWFATYSPMTIGSVNDPPSDHPKEGPGSQRKER